MSVFVTALVAVAGLLMVEKLWRVALIVRFFRQPPVLLNETEPGLVSVLQPVMGGDPNLTLCLEESLQMQTRYRVAFWYLLDAGDTDAERVCGDLQARYPQTVAGILRLPPPPEGVSPKLFKLAAGQAASSGDIVCCLDDDTSLPDFGLDKCVPYLNQPGVGVAFGLPYYRSFENFWSAYVASFVNASSLLTYIPYTFLCPPFTINGMFFAVKRSALESVGGFDAILPILADDFGVAKVFRDAGYTLAQTPLRHGIRTHVRDFRHLRQLLGRWFTAPRESLLRHLSPKERALLVGMGVCANVLPVALLIAALAARQTVALAAWGVFFAVAQLTLFFLNRRYLYGATPFWALWLLMPLILVLFPIQMLLALLAPRQRVHWRGNVMEPSKGGTFRFVARRDN